MRMLLQAPLVAKHPHDYNANANPDSISDCMLMGTFDATTRSLKYLREISTSNLEVWTVEATSRAGEQHRGLCNRQSARCTTTTSSAE